MAPPQGMIATVAWFSSPEVAVISVVVFLVLGATLLALCARCNKKPTNAYDVNGSTNGGGTKGISNPNMGDATNLDYSWRNHSNMPVSTLQRN